ncbi:hypothetical protein PCASD_21377, partial [Puccinia coronata f. sp. avenae]
RRQPIQERQNFSWDGCGTRVSRGRKGLCIKSQGGRTGTPITSNRTSILYLSTLAARRCGFRSAPDPNLQSGGNQQYKKHP